jgi:hypothetical protein
MKVRIVSSAELARKGSFSPREFIEDDKMAERPTEVDKLKAQHDRRIGKLLVEAVKIRDLAVKVVGIAAESQAVESLSVMRLRVAKLGRLGDRIVKACKRLV